jgi:MFS family permease
VACAVLFGLSAGAVDAALNAYAARHFGVRQVNLMHAAYGIGAATSPLIVTAVIGMGRGWRWAYITVMAIQALLAALFAGTLRRWRDASAEPVAVAAASTEDQSSGRPRWWRRTPAVGGLLVVAVQTGLKSAITDRLVGLQAAVSTIGAVVFRTAVGLIMGVNPNGIRELRPRPRTHQQRWTLDTTSRTPPVKLPIHSHGERCPVKWARGKITQEE